MTETTKSIIPNQRYLVEIKSKATDKNIDIFLVENTKLFNQIYTALQLIYKVEYYKITETEYQMLLKA